MKSKLISYYRILLNNYYHYQKKDNETAKKLAYASVRNLIGVAIFMFLLLVYTIAAAIVPGPHSIVLGGLSLMIGLVGTAYSN